MGQRERQAKYREIHRETLRRRNQISRIQNPDLEKARQQRWYSQPDKRAIRLEGTHRRKAIALGLYEAPVELKQIYLRDGGICQLCHTRKQPGRVVSNSHCIRLNELHHAGRTGRHTLG